MSTFMIAHDQEPLKFDDWPQQFASFMIPGHHYPRLKVVLPNLMFQDQVLLLHSELRSAELEKFKQDGAIDVYWWAHAAIARDWYRYAELDHELNNKNVQKQFLVYNRAWGGTREYRLKFAEMVVDQGLSKHCVMGFNACDSGDYQNYQFTNKNFTITRNDLESYFFNNQTTSDASADYYTLDYQSTAVEVVLETLFDDSRWHLTEKTLRPIACGQPFILCATPGSLQYLKSYGFETFESLWDESYDSVLDPVERLRAITGLMKTLSTKPIEFFDAANQIAQRNKARFFSQEFFDNIIGELRHNISLAHATAQKHCSGAYFKRLVQHDSFSPAYTPFTSDQVALLLSALSAKLDLK